MSIRAIFGAVLIFVTPIGAALSEDNVGIGVVDAMNKLFGKHEGFVHFTRREQSSRAASKERQTVLP